MSSQQTTVDFIVEQLTGAGKVSSRKMFGEYALYCEERVVALVCDDQLFVKPTQGGETFIKKSHEVELSPPYPGAKPYFLISGEFWDDRDWMSELIRITTAEVPLPKKKK